VSNSQDVRNHQERAGEVFEIIVRLGIVFLLLGWGVMIVAPFLHPIAWGVADSKFKRHFQHHR